MNKSRIVKIVKSILTNHFNVSLSDSDWDKPLESLNKDFEVLGVLIDLEKILQEYFNNKVLLIKQIDPTFNTPKDIVALIKKIISPEEDA